jgi:cell division protein FtsQ
MRRVSPQSTQGSSKRPSAAAGGALRKRQSATSRRLRQRLRTGGLVAVMGGALGLGAWAMVTGRVADGLGWSWDQALGLSAMAGFSVQEVVVLGRGVTAREDLWAALEVERGDPIFAFDAAAARERLIALPWISEATIERRLPDQLYLTIDEREPVAIWQHDGTQRLIDADGVELTRQAIGRWSHLPLVVGPAAHQHAADFLDELSATPAVADAMTAAIRIGDRRWDLILAPDVRVFLPEDNAPAALAHLQHLIVEEAVLLRDVAAIDLRLPGRTVIRRPASLTSDAPVTEENT